MMDLISGLPDSVLVHILSLLPTKEAVSSCLISQRWTSLWHRITKLEFDDQSFGSHDSFIQFVDATLVMVDLNRVQTFVMKIEKVVPPIKFLIWLQALLLRNSIAHLELYSQEQIGFMLPASVFKFSTITILKLRGVFMGNISTFHFSSLKVLHLVKAIFARPNDLLVLLSHCPLHLEELVVKSSIRPDACLPLHIARFEHLRLVDVPERLFLMETLSNVQFLTLRQNKQNPPLCLPTFHNVIHLEIADVYNYKWAIVDFLPSFPKLQSLVFLNFGIHEADRGKRFIEYKPHWVPPCISSHLEELAIDNFTGGKHEFQLVRFIMENASVLRTVVMVRRLLGRSSSEIKDLEMSKTLLSFTRISAKCRLFFETDSTNSDEALKKYLTIRKTSVAPSY